MGTSKPQEEVNVFIDKAGGKVGSSAEGHLEKKQGCPERTLEPAGDKNNSEAAGPQTD